MHIPLKKSIKFLVIGLLSAFATTAISMRKEEDCLTFIVTGFEPFGGGTVNPSWEAVKLLPDRIGNIKLIKLELPVSYRRSYFPLQKAIQQHDPVGVLSVGVDNIKGFNIEPYAYNLDNASLPDNDDVSRKGQLIISNGSSALKIVDYFPIDDIVTSLSQQGFVINKTPGSSRFLCNHVFYLLLNELNHHKIPAGFMHVPMMTYYNIGQDRKALEQSIRIILERTLKYSPKQIEKDFTLKQTFI